MPATGWGEHGRADTWGAIVGNETKVGLLVGVVFIVLFGVILGSRVGSAADDHAPLPVGDSRRYEVLADAMDETVDPFADGGRSLMIENPAAGETEPAEERMRAPDDLPGTGPDGPADPAETDEDEASTGRLALGPARVETPMPAPPSDGAPPVRVRPEAPAPPEETEPAAEGAPAPRPGTPAPPSRPVHVVRKGETLTTIATKYYGDDGPRLWRRVWEANKDTVPDPDRLRPGQKLVIPGVPAQAPPPPTRIADAGEPAETGDDVPEVGLDGLARRFHVLLDEKAPGTAPHGAGAGPADDTPTYTVRKGDTFYSIAREVYGDLSAAKRLMQKNRDRVPDARRLRIGQTILLLDRKETAAESEDPANRVAAVATP